MKTFQKKIKKEDKIEKKNYIESDKNQILNEKIYDENAIQLLLILEKYLLYYDSLHSSFDYLQINIASSDKIKYWGTRYLWIEKNHPKKLDIQVQNNDIENQILESLFEKNTNKTNIKSNKLEFLKEIGRVYNFETLSYKNLSPITGGLFCEKIFGPVESWHCRCQEYVGFFPDIICTNCNVELIDSRVRRYRMGYINVPYPLGHTWFYRGRPSYLSQILNTKRSILESILYGSQSFSQNDFDFSLLSKKEDKNLYHPFYYYSYSKNQKFAYFFKIFSYLTSCILNIHKKILLLFKNNSFNILKQKIVLNKKINDLKLQYNKNLNKKFYKEIKKNQYTICFNVDILKALKQIIFDYSISKTNIDNINYSLILTSPFDFLSAKNSVFYPRISFFDQKKRLLNLFHNYYIKYLRNIKKNISFLAINQSFDQIGENYAKKEILRAYRVNNEFDIISQAKDLKKEKKEFLDSSELDTINYSKFLDYNDEKRVNSEIHSFINERICSLTTLKKERFHRYGGEIIYSMLADIEVKKEILMLRNYLFILKNDDKNMSLFSKKLRLFESLHATNTSPTAFMLKIIPVLPPTLRPLSESESGVLISADINNIYHLLLVRLATYGIKDLSNNYSWAFHSLRLIQEGLDSLIDNARLPVKKQILLNERPLKTLTQILEGKEGRFRQNILGKRVDYSARTVIVSAPELKINQCGIPFLIAKILFEPFLIKKLLDLEFIKNNKFYQKETIFQLLERKNLLLWPLLLQLSKNYSILLNRAPTLHKFGIQAFDPLISISKEIQLHPLVCPGFNADFDGDQMAIHLPLNESSQLESKTLLRSSANTLSSANSDLILKPSQDIVIGLHYLTFITNQQKNFYPKIFNNFNDIFRALYNKSISLHTRILVNYSFNEISFFEKDNILYFSSDFFPIFEKKIKFFNSIKNDKYINYYFTNIGILVGYNFQGDDYVLSNVYLDTSPGRLIFGLTIEESKKRKI